MMGMAAKAAGKSSKVRAWILRIIGLVIACYGIYAFGKRGIGTYMTLQSTFVFFNFDEPLALFYVDYLAVMGLFVWIGHYLAKILRSLAGCNADSGSSSGDASDDTQDQSDSAAQSDQSADETSSDTESNEENTPDRGASDGKTLVVYYSATGNTEAVANYIAAATGGDLFELEPGEPYTDEDLNYNDENSRVS